MGNPFGKSELPKLWFTFKDSADVEWRVYRGNKDSIPQLADAEGICLVESAVIGIQEDLDPRRALVVLGHELLHACLGQVGDATVLSRVLGTSLADVSDREEQIVSLLAPRLFGLLLRNHLIRFPKVPR